MECPSAAPKTAKTASEEALPLRAPLSILRWEQIGVSTDWGYRCLQCEESKIIDNCRHPEDLRGLLQNFDAAKKLMSLGFDISSPGWDNTNYVLLFVQSHLDRGHTVVVVDEYGGDYGECGEYWSCTDCGTNLRCRLPANHDGWHYHKRK